MYLKFGATDAAGVMLRVMMGVTAKLSEIIFFAE